MATKKKSVRKRKKKTSTRRQTYVPIGKKTRKQISEFSKFIPSLEKYKGKTRLTSAEYGAYQRAKKKLLHTSDLRPVTAKQAKKLKNQLVGGGVRAIRLRNTSDKDTGTKIKTVRNDGVIVTTNGRDWEYHPIDVSNPSRIVENLIEKGRELFNRAKHPPWQLHLWTNKGRENNGENTFKKWAARIAATFGKYQDAAEFVVGVAALVRDGSNGYREEITDKAKPKKVTIIIEDDEEE